MRTPGRCSNIEGCWISASAKTVFIPLGDNFACPNCGTLLRPPSPADLSRRSARLPAAAGAALAACVAVSLGAAGLLHGHGAVRTAQAHPAPLLAMATPGQPSLRAHAAPAMTVAAAKPSRAAGRAAAILPPAIGTPEITLLAQATLQVPAQAARPLVLPVTFGRPTAPEDAIQPESRSWRDHRPAHHHRWDLARAAF